MKMPEKHDLLAAILAAKEQGIGAILAFAMAYLRGRYNGGAFTKTVIDATMCAIIAWFIRDLLDFAGLSSNLAYITSVFIGYIGTDSIGSLIKRFAAKKSRSRRWWKSNNQRKAFLDMLAWSEGTDNGRQKTRNHGYDVIVGGELFTDYSDHPRKLVTLNPKLKSTAAGRYQLLSRWWDAYRKQLGLKDFSPKSQDAVALQQIKERGALPMIDRGDIRQAIDRCSNIWLHCRALVMVSSSIRLTT